eukprot:3536385-Rhodomonas_salina.1
MRLGRIRSIVLHGCYVMSGTDIGAAAARLAETHWSKLRSETVSTDLGCAASRLRVMAGDILLSLGDPVAAAAHYRRVIDKSPDIRTHHTSQRYYAKLGLCLRSAAAALQDEEAAEDEEQERDEQEVALEQEAVSWLTAARDEMHVLYGEGHWACERVKGELEQALAVTIAARCRKKPRVADAKQ